MRQPVWTRPRPEPLGVRISGLDGVRATSTLRGALDGRRNLSGGRTGQRSLAPAPVLAADHDDNGG